MADFDRDAAALATHKQILGVGAIFSGPDFKRVEEYKERDMSQAYRILACIKTFHNEAKVPMTHGEIQKIREGKTLPKKYRDLFDESKVGMNTAKKEKAKTEPTPVVDGIDLNDPETIKAFKAFQALMAKSNTDKPNKSKKTTKAKEVGDTF
jgi:hypothetical protein